MTDLQVRSVTAADARLLWAWRNDPDTRQNAFNSEPIPWASHVRWFEGKLHASGSRIWILEEQTIPIGQARYERELDSTATVNYSVDAAHRGKGMGTALLALTVPRACLEMDVRVIVGLVKVSNIASCRAFGKAGFERVTELRVGDSTCVRFEAHCHELGRGPDVSA